MKIIKKLTRLTVLLLLIWLFFTRCKDKKESEIPRDFKHTKNTEEFESSSTIAEGKELIKQEEAGSTPKADESETKKGQKSLILQKRYIGRIFRQKVRRCCSVFRLLILKK
ncbi:hypothetical protein NE686_11150 [Tissierella carlieri]|uniref:Lipoprotein n=1 Tax=Tissierella carlieri TaxID=689904 RepID=A0ABT1SAZ9_9FIRM|nr:hypothetical protein [Tissierella carlieri]MCQ4923648.1 hypothetical protein [Tissierella carlieri]